MTEFMERALTLAKEAMAHDEVPVGAVIVKNGKIISEGMNTRETAQNPLGHAEVNAILGASKALGSWRLEGCTLVCTLEPCLMCLGAIQQARIERVVFSAEDAKGGALSLGYRFHSDTRLNHRFEVDRQPDVRCEEILKEFFKRKRATL